MPSLTKHLIFIMVLYKESHDFFKFFLITFFIMSGKSTILKDRTIYPSSLLTVHILLRYNLKKHAQIFSMKFKNCVTENSNIHWSQANPTVRSIHIYMNSIRLFCLNINLMKKNLPRPQCLQPHTSSPFEQKNGWKSMCKVSTIIIDKEQEFISKHDWTIFGPIPRLKSPVLRLSLIMRRKNTKK